MGKGKKGKAAPDSPEAEDFMGGLSMLELGNDWNSSGPGGWGTNEFDDDDDDEDDDEDEEEEEEEPVRQRGRKQPQSHYQNPKQNMKGQPKHKVPQGNQGHPGPQNGRNNNPHRSQDNPQQRKQPQNQNKSKTNQKGQQGQKVPKQHQEPSGGAIPEWEVNEHGGWNLGGDHVGNVGGGGSDRGVSGNHFNNQYQQRRLASLLEDIPEEGERGSNQQWPKRQGRPMTAAEHVKAAASGMAPSRTLLYAASSSATSILDGGSRGGPHTSVSVVSSQGAALEEARRALYSRQRPASQRIHWMFSPMKEEKVALLLDWIQAMNHGLATFGVHMFLRSQQRGALIANVDFRAKKHPNAPAFDWVTFDDVIETHDKILQESIAFYEPDNQVLVRKLAVPIAVRNQNHTEITRLTNMLARRKYVVTVDELPRPPPQTKPKKKWLPW